MGIKKVMVLGFGITIILLNACSNHQHDLGILKGNNLDTSYQITTKTLKSNNIPDSVFNMLHLKSLSIQGMDCDFGNHSDCWMITEIPSNIQNLTALTSLSLTVNALTKLPDELKLLRHLKSLDLSDNTGLTDINIIANLDSLQYFYLYGCGLSKMPAAIGSRKLLKELGLKGNPIDTIEMKRIRMALPDCNIIFN